MFYNLIVLEYNTKVLIILIESKYNYLFNILELTLLKV